MSLDLWFKDDIRNTLLALHQAGVDADLAVHTASGRSEATAAYRRGYADALRAVGIAFGITQPRGAAQRDDAIQPPVHESVPLRIRPAALIEDDGPRS